MLGPTHPFAAEAAPQPPAPAPGPDPAKTDEQFSQLDPQQLAQLVMAARAARQAGQGASALLVNSPGPGVGTRPFADPQQLAQLVMAARAAQQGGQAASAAQPSAQAQAPPTSVLPPTSPFAAGAGAAFASGAAGPQRSVRSADPGPAKAAVIQRLRQAQADSQVQQTPGPQAKGKRAADPFPRLETPSADDIDNGNYIKVGFRHLLRHDPSKVFFHSYADIPVMENGKVKLDQNGKPVFESFGVLGNPESRENQQLRRNDPRNAQVPHFEGKENWVKVAPEQREALRQGMRYFTERDEKGNFKNPCPVCGSRYGKIPLDRNSNTLLYNMLFWNPAGPIPAPPPPSRWWTPAYYVNEPNEQWYPPQKSSK